ncbi:PKD domain-containing protein [Microbacterium sp. ZOR0019]|uniref:PKD domain-containing protein n=1 Tax=Microbacterium sp. ZOR0019 TaxID=1339233 RepID=UPI0006921EDC|nr:PKD domain-containing protein [Microbacterium sp. ZOR0019]
MKHTNISKRARSALASFVAGALLVAGMTTLGAQAATAADVPQPPPLLQRDDNVVTSDPIPTVQIDNGYVWAQTTIGSTVYAVGKFDNARAPLATPGTSLTARSNVLAYDINSGQLLPFAPQVNGVIKAVAASPDGSRIYIGGSFNSVNGQARWNFAALDATTGQLVGGFSPAIGGTGVYALATSGTSVFVGGLFTQGNGTARKNLAAFSSTNGALLAWAPQADLQVDAMVMDPAGQNVIAAGRFSQVNGNLAMRGTVALDKDTGAVDDSWALPQTVKNGATSGKAGIFGLAADANAVYGTGWVYANAATGNLEGTFAAEAGSGQVRWISDCLGDHYGVYSTGKVVYTTSHTHACSTQGLHPEQNPRTHRYSEAYTADARGTLGNQPAAGSTYKNWVGTPAPSAYAWTPDWAVGVTTGLGQAGLSITGAGNMISIGGEFRSVNNGRFEGLVRFSTTPPGGAKDGPRLSGENWVPTAQSFIPGRVRVSIPLNWDRDDLALTYELRRAGTSTAVASKTVDSTWWDRSSVTLDDTSTTPGSQQQYTVVAKDGDGNTASSQSVTVAVADGVVSPYVDAVTADEPQLYYPLGTVAQDWAGSNTPVFGSGVNSVSSGVQNTTTGASSFSGSSSGRVATSARVAAPKSFSTELWFRTNTNSGGKLLGYGSAASGDSSSYDRHLYMTNSGRLVFGTYNGSTQTAQNNTALNDNTWHHAVATQDSSGMRLYVDGELVSSLAGATDAENYTGYWRVGGDNLNGWPSSPSSKYFSGSLDEVAVYPYALTPAQIRTHYGVGKGFQAPTASFTASATNLEVAFDASASAPAGVATITGYRWDFGDDSASATGKTVNHTYEAGGTYTTRLTVTDSNGLTSTTEQQVTVQGANVAPTASFELSASGLAVSADASASTDPDGSITSYAWDWGDGSTSTGQVASHTYASAGTRTVTLTVTDDRNGTGSTTREAVTTHADPVAMFTSTASGLKVDVSAAGSSASDGATLAYSWNWGDGTPAGSGATATHTYAEAGAKDITLTVSDSLGSSASTTQSVTVQSEVFAAADSFGRLVSSGWGAADIGGTWAPMAGSAAVTSVADGVGTVNLGPGETREMLLQGTSLRDTEARISYTLTSGPSTGVAYEGLGARRSGSNGYRALVWHRADGSTWLVIHRNGTAIASTAVPGTTWAAGSTFHLAMETAGSSPTTIRAKIWAAGSTEPEDWQLTTTDATPALQVAGATTVFSYRAGSASGTNPINFDDFAVKDLAAPAPEPDPEPDPEPENAAPTAAFTAAVSDLTADVNGGASADSDGTIASYAWEFGDGSSGTGATASHTYTAAGTYTVSLTVTDDKGATNTATQQVTVTAAPTDPDPDPEPEQPGALASDEFDRTATSGWGTAPTGGAWTIAGGSAAAATVSDGNGRMALAAGGTRYATLDGTPLGDVVIETAFTVDQTPTTGGSYIGVVARGTAAGKYLVRAWLRPDGSLWLVAHREGTVLATQAVTGFTWAADTSYTLKVSVTGSSTTALAAKIWATGSSEPANWQLNATDATPLAATGSVGLAGNRSGSSTATLGLAFDTFRVTAP